MNPLTIQCPSCGRSTELNAFRQVEILASLKQPCDYETITCKCGDQTIIKARHKFKAPQ